MIATLQPKRKKVTRRRKEVDTSTLKGRFAERLLTLRLRAGLDVSEMASKLGIPEGTYHNYERATSIPPLDLWDEIAKIFGISIRELLPEDGNKNVISTLAKSPDISTYEGRFAVRLRGLRESAMISVSEMARSIGIEPEIYTKYESGICTPPIEIAFRIAQKLDIPVSVFSLEIRKK
jgi:transcriptional regulator with XRE-family HTH domain